MLPTTSDIADQAKPVTVAECAARFGVSDKRVRRCLDAGVDGIVQRGRKGRGDDSATLIDYARFEASMNERGLWSHSQQISVVHGVIKEMAEATYEQFRSNRGAHKVELAANLVLAFYRNANILHSHYGLPPMHEMDAPQCIRQMDQIQAI